MKINSLFPRLAVVSALVVSGAVVASGQSYYDDDIYYDASKAPKKEVKKSRPSRTGNTNTGTSTQLYYDGAQYEPWNNVGEYQSADQYQATGTSTRDVDEYNRRYSSVGESRSSMPDSISLQQFEEMSNTRKLARFQNSDIASQAYARSEYDDAGYYADGYNNGYVQPTTTINLNVVGGYPYYGYPYYGYGYYGSPWYWNRWGYDPWWGPSWSWNWGWGGPSWSWSWGWGGPGWGPAWGPSWGPSWGGGWHGRPNYTSSGAFAPNTTRRPSGNSYRNISNSGTTYRYGNYSGGNRTGNSSARPGNSVSTNRPGYRQPIGTPSVNNGGTRGRNTGTYNQNHNYNSNSNQSTYRYNSNSSNYNRGSSFGSGSRGSSSGSFGGNRGGFSGGNRTGGGGGGGHRGR